MSRLSIVKIEDHEGDGRCGHCGREGLRWVITLSDSTTIGSGCAKAVLGYAVAAKDYKWTADFTAVEEKGTAVLWEAREGAQTRMTVNGVLVCVGGGRERFAAL